jgi:hypothetical protein
LGFPRQVVLSPAHLNHFEVIVPFRVFPGKIVASSLGYLLPVGPYHQHDARPRWYFTSCPRSKTRLLKRSSLEVRSSFMVFTRNPRPRSHDQEQTLLRFSSPSACETARVHVPPQRAPDETRKPHQNSTDRSHPASYGAAPRLSQPLSDLAPLTAAPSFSDR